MVKKTVYNCIILLMVLGIYGCDEATLVGYDLLEGEDIAVQFSDSLSLDAYSVIGDPPISNFRNSPRYSVGSLDDPIFGKTQVDLYTTLSYRNSTNIDNTVLDSVVLVFEYDSLSFYGNWEDASYDVQVFLGLDNIPNSDTLFADQILLTGRNPIAEINNISYDYRDSLLLLDSSLDSVTLQAPQLRIKLGREIAERMYNTISDIANTDELQDLYPFLKISITSNNGSTVGVNYSSNSLSSSSTSGLFFYMQDSTETSEVYRYGISTARNFSVIHNKEGYAIDQFLDNPDLGDSLVFVQSLGGAYTIVDIGAIRNIENALMNKVELVMTLAEGPDFDADIYDPSAIYYAYYINEDGERTVITGDNNSPTLGVNTSIFGGLLEETVITETGEDVRQVRMNLTYHVLQLLDNPDLSSEIIITPADEISRARRAVFYGPKHSQYPMKINLAYTIN